MKKRIIWIDMVKGVAILLVVIGHIIPKTNFLSRFIYSFHIPIFFIISGYIFSMKNIDRLDKKYFIKRIYTLLYPYLTLSIFALLTESIVSVMVRERISIFDSVFDILILDGYFATWFLPCLFFAELIFIFIYKNNQLSNTNNRSIGRILYTNNKLIKIILLFILTIIVIIFYNLNIQLNSLLINKFFYKILGITVRIFVGSIFITLGYNLSKLINGIKSNNLILLLAILINSILCQFNGKVDLYYMQFNNLFLYFYFSISTSILIICLLKNINLNVKIVKYFGQNSIIIMATHLPFIWLLRKIIKFNYNIVNYLFIFLGIFIIEILLVSIFNKYLNILLDYRNVKNSIFNEGKSD